MVPNSRNKILDVFSPTPVFRMYNSPDTFLLLIENDIVSTHELEDDMYIAQ